MELAALVKKTISLSAKKVYVQNLPQVEKTPKIILLDPKVQKFVEQMVLYFNQTLAQGLKDQKAKLLLLAIKNMQNFPISNLKRWS